MKISIAISFLVACNLDSRFTAESPDAPPGVPPDVMPDMPEAPAVFAQHAFLKASNTDASDHFGTRVAIAADGNTMVISATGESSAATGVNGNANDNSLSSSGAAYVFVRSGASWAQQAYLKASNPGVNDGFGADLAISDDGNTIAVGAAGEDGGAVGINNAPDDTKANSGAAYVFVRSGTVWSLQAYVKASNTDAGDLFGCAVSLSANGNTLAVGAFGEDSSATGIDGNQADNSQPNNGGAAYVYMRSGSTWTQQAYVKPSNTPFTDQFGFQLALSDDGDTLAVGARHEKSSSTGIDGGQNNAGAPLSGAVYVYKRASTTWSQQAYIKATNTTPVARFGSWVALAGDGNTLAVGAVEDPSGAVDVGGDQSDTSASQSGAVYVLTRSGTT